MKRAPAAVEIDCRDLTNRVWVDVVCTSSLTVCINDKTANRSKLSIVREKLGNFAKVEGFPRAVMSRICTSNFRMTSHKCSKLLPVLGDE